jgi:hypothetical protein
MFPVYGVSHANFSGSGTQILANLPTNVVFSLRAHRNYLQRVDEVRWRLAREHLPKAAHFTNHGLKRKFVVNFFEAAGVTVTDHRTPPRCT